MKEPAGGRYYEVQAKRLGLWWHALRGNTVNRHSNTEKAKSWLEMYEKDFVVMQYDERDGEWEKTWG
jgi:hypothetical protein